LSHLFTQEKLFKSVSQFFYIRNARTVFETHAIKLPTTNKNFKIQTSNKLISQFSKTQQKNHSYFAASILQFQEYQ